MTGLIIKDVMCLRKQIKTFTYVILCVLIVSVMYVLSARFGNIALAGKGILASNDMTLTDVRNLGTLFLVLFMILPIASVGDMVNVFEADEKSGFYKLAGAFPISLKKRLLSKFCTVYLLLGIGVSIDILIAFILSRLTDLISFGEFLGIILSSASVTSIYSTLIIFFYLLLGYGKGQYAQLFSLTTMAATFILVKFDAVNEFLKTLLIDSSVTGESMSNTLNWGMLDFIKEKFLILICIAVITSLLSYFASLLIVQRKRGMI